MRKFSPGCAQSARPNTTRVRAAGWETDEMSVTDDSGRVHEVEGLRVIDASIMPNNITANLNAPVIMMAEKNI